MFDVGLRPEQRDAPFRYQLPVFNWFYPFPSAANLLPRKIRALASFGSVPGSRTAVYLHIPFCETICRFCPFTRGVFRSDKEIDEYLESLVREIRLKCDIIGRPLVQCIYIGGGSPSLLSVDAILRLGDSINGYFLLAPDVEFSVELEPKSISAAKLLALTRIGVNRVSVGVQSFDEEIRKAFNLTATLRDVSEGVGLATSVFSSVNIDIIYGTLRKELEVIERTVDAAIQLGATTIDFYPLNNIAAQPGMHRVLLGAGHLRANARDRLEQRQRVLDEMTRRGFSRINGYGYGQTLDKAHCAVQKQPRFLYHDILYGHARDMVIGYGAGALSYSHDAVLVNTPNRSAYTHRLLEANLFTFEAYNASGSDSKGLVTFPYRGAIGKDSFYETSWCEGIRCRIAELIDAGLVIDKGDRLEVSESGWLYYVNMMYYLMPEEGKKWLSDRIATRLSKGATCEETSLD
jgi:oxygen-independent coproporphyrinogen-3 oxidase